MNEAIIGMLLRSLGIDVNPEDLKAKAFEVVDYIVQLKASQLRVEEKLNTLLEKTDRLEKVSDRAFTSD